jgi:hypothetical protein
LSEAQSFGKGKADPLQAWSGPEGSRELRFSDFMTTAQEGVKVVSLTHRPPWPPGNNKRRVEATEMDTLRRSSRIKRKDRIINVTIR